MKKLLIISIVYISSVFSINGQDIKVTASFDSSRIFIGDQIHYIVTIVKPLDIPVFLNPLKDTLCKNVEIVSGPASDSLVMPDRMLKITRKYLVTSFDSGFYQVPPVYVEIKNAAGIKRFYSDYSPLQVMRVRIAPADTTAKIFDIIKPYRAPVTFGEILPWIIIVVIAAALAWGAVLLIRKLKKDIRTDEPVKSTEPAHIIAFRELEKLKKQELWQKGEVKYYYTRLTEILREYVENRYGVCSLEMTTSETLEALIKTGFKKDDSYNLLKTVLNGADLVKFAKYKPEPAENEEHFDNSWKFVENTKLVEVISEDDKSDEGKEVRS
ncbi:MAG: hypothetical protein ABSA76_04805 [Bacteroidales bacterium]